MTRAALASCVVIAACCASVRPAFAQSGNDGGRIEISAGGAWVGSLDFGSATAVETTPTLGARPLFTASTTVAPLPIVEGRVGWRFTRSVTAELEGSYGRPELRIALSNDDENAPPVTASERVQQYTVGGALVWHLPVGSPRVSPFATAGAGYLRQLHESGTLAQTGRYYQFGGGLTVLIASRGNAFVKTMGIRLDARALIRTNGIAYDDAARAAPVAGASFFVRF